MTKQNLNILRKEAMPFIHKYYVEKHRNGDAGVGIYKDDKEIPTKAKKGKMIAFTNKGREKKMWKILDNSIGAGIPPEGPWKQANLGEIVKKITSKKPIRVIKHNYEKATVLPHSKVVTGLDYLHKTHPIKTEIVKGLLF